jgi:hypothetical protein
VGYKSSAKASSDAAGQWRCCAPRKKKLHWYSTFGEIEVVEQTYIDKYSGQLRRPFQTAAQILCRGYSLPLQRVITDFGADNAFGRVPDKLLEHYGIELAQSAAVMITEQHAHALTEAQMMPLARPATAALTLVAQTDGSMIPVVQTGSATAGDRRKTRTLIWREARLALVRRDGEVDPVFAVTLGDPAATGELLKQLAVASGFNAQSRVHALGDGAPWIAQQMEQQFGAQGGYLIDFYHLCDYLADAARVCAKECPDQWMTLQKERLKTGHLSLVMDALHPFVEPDTTPTVDAPVRQCYGYIARRPGQFKYKEAIAANLPIGSGEVESAHRYVIQKRLKLPGAWWKEDNAQAMLNLRAARANHRWDDYWKAMAA